MGPLDVVKVDQLSIILGIFEIPRLNERNSYETLFFFKIFNDELSEKNALMDKYHCVKVSKYGVFSGPYLPVLGLNTGKYGLEKTPHLDTFQAVMMGAPYFLSMFVEMSLSQKSFLLKHDIS